MDRGLTDTEGARAAGLSLREYQRVKASALRARQADASAALVRVLERIAVALEKLAGPVTGVALHTMATVQRVCPCGRRFKVKASAAASGHGRYCSKECQRLWPAERGADHRTLPELADGEPEYRGAS